WLVVPHRQRGHVHLPAPQRFDVLPHAVGAHARSDRGAGEVERVRPGLGEGRVPRPARRRAEDALVARRVAAQRRQGLGRGPARLQPATRAGDRQLAARRQVALEPAARGLLHDHRRSGGEYRETADQAGHDADRPRHDRTVAPIRLRITGFLLPSQAVRLEDLGLVGNCQISALVARNGDVAWMCLPRFDSDPVFSTLLDENHGGRFGVGPHSGELGAQRYVDNTNVLETPFTTPSGVFRTIDFAPRFIHDDRMYRPTLLVRVVEPIQGAPRIRVACDPRLGWSRARPAQLVGSNHVRYEGFAAP